MQYPGVTPPAPRPGYIGAKAVGVKPGYIGAKPVVVRAGYIGAKPLTAGQSIAAQNRRPAPKATMSSDARASHQAVVAQQTFLRNRGYHVKPDGNHGPHTKAAVAAYHSNVHPAVFNRVSKHGGGIRTKNGTIPVPRAGTGVKPIAARGANASDAPAATDPTAGAATDPTAGGSDIAAQAQAQIDAIYGPQEDMLRQQMAAAQAAGQAGVQNLGKWYGDVAQTQAAGAQSNLQGTQDILGAAGAADANILGLFGGPQANPAAGEAAAYGSINRNEIAGMGEAQQGFDTSMAPIIGLQKNDALAANSARTQQAMQAISDQFAQLQSAKTNDYMQALSQANSSQMQQQDYNLRLQDAQHNWAHQDLQDQSAQQSIDIANALMPGKLRAQGLQNANTKSQIDSRYNQAVLASKRYGISKMNAMSNIKRTDAYISNLNTKMARDAKKGQVNWNDPNTIGQLQDNVRGLIQGKKGGFRMHPGLAEQNLYSGLASLGVPRAVAQRVGQTLMVQTLNNSHGMGQWQHFGVNKNGQIVRTSKQPPKKKK